MIELISTQAHSFKSRVRQAFSAHAMSYDRHAGIQAHAAAHSAALLSSIKSRLAVPDGDILEIGCGTGLFSSRLVSLFPERRIICSDLSESMLQACKLRLTSEEPAGHLDFQVIDGEYLNESPAYAMIASSFTFQWFFEPLQGLMRLFTALKPGGILLFSVPGSESCPEWRQAAKELQIPFTRNPMPSTEQLQKLAVRSCMEFRINDHFVVETYPNAISMLRSMKELGAGTQRNGQQLSSRQLRRLLGALDNSGKPIVTSFQVIAGYFRRAR